MNKMLFSSTICTCAFWFFSFNFHSHFLLIFHPAFFKKN